MQTSTNFLKILFSHTSLPTDMSKHTYKCIPEYYAFHRFLYIPMETSTAHVYTSLPYTSFKKYPAFTLYHHSKHLNTHKSKFLHMYKMAHYQHLCRHIDLYGSISLTIHFFTCKRKNATK